LILEFPSQETNKHIYPSSVIRPLLPLVLYSYADFRATMSLLLLLTLAILVYEETKISSDNVALFTWKQKCSSSLFFSIDWMTEISSLQPTQCWRNFLSITVDFSLFYFCCFWNCREVWTITTRPQGQRSKRNIHPNNKKVKEKGITTQNHEEDIYVNFLNL